MALSGSFFMQTKDYKGKIKDFKFSVVLKAEIPYSACTIGKGLLNKMSQAELRIVP